MKKIRIIVLLIMLFSFNFSFSQLEKTPDRFKNQIKFSPLRIIDFVNPGVEISYERMYLDNKFSTQISGAYMKDVILSMYDYYKGYRIAIEEKWFFLRKSSIRLYSSLNFVYLNAELRKSFPATKISPRSYNLDRETYTSNANIGIQLMKGYFIFEFNLGLGLKYKNLIYDYGSDSDNEKSKYFTLNIPANVKIGFMF